MMRYRIDSYLICLAYLCSTLLGDAAQAEGNKLPSPCQQVDHPSRQAHLPCTGPDTRDTSPPPQPAPKNDADKDLLPKRDSKQTSQDDENKAHFDANGRTGLIPVGRMGWHEIGSWREMHRARGNGQEPR